MRDRTAKRQKRLKHIIFGKKPCGRDVGPRNMPLADRIHIERRAMCKEGLLYKAINQDNGAVLANKLRVAQTFKSRSQGLLNRNGLEQGEALLIQPCTSIHTFFMKFPIDVAFLDRKGRVVKIAKNIRPWRLSGCLFGAHMVIEFNAGTLTNSLINVGNVVKIEAN
ncbi:MAG: DUF192 domain-containing protein [Candidatus Omnitrophota bacterium]